MDSRTRLTTAIAVLVSALVVSASALAAPRRVPHDFLGMNFDEEVAFQATPSLQDAQFAGMAAAGVEAVRASFLWATAQPIAAGPFAFDATDRLVAMAARHGLTLLPIVIDAPLWARAFETDFSPPSVPADYALYLVALIHRYGPSGSFWNQHPALPRRPIRSWQIWNEPHLSYQWSISTTVNEDWAVRYSNLLTSAYEAVKAADAGAQVVLAGLANESPSYLAHLYRFGVRDHFDVAAIHPYTATAQGVLTLARTARAVMGRNGDAHKPLWITELGLPASRGRSTSTQTIQTSDAGMARFVTDTFG